MDQNQKSLVELLALSLQGKKASYDFVSATNWISVLEMAQKHSVLPLIYTTLNEEWIDQKILADLKSTVFNLALQQIQNLEILERVLDEFCKVGIPLLAMKGLVLRDIYPYPETRTMSDIDLAVKDENFDKALRILERLGFKEISSSSLIHAEMINDQNLLLELHRKFFYENLVNLPQDFVDELWSNAIPVFICGRTVLSFSNVDNLLYLLLHIQKHYEEGGIGVRYLCDIVLFINAKQDTIDWEQFFIKASDLQILRYALIIFKICNQLFGMNIPKYFEQKEMPNGEMLDSVIQDILEGGTFGKNSLTSIVSKNVSHTIGFQDYSGFRSFFGLIKFFFPMANKLGEKYFYTKKYPMLLPVAWVHRWIYNTVNKQKREMIKVLMDKDLAKESLEIMWNRGVLVNWIKEKSERAVRKKG
jgi:hypothetical protein